MKKTFYLYLREAPSFLTMMFYSFFLLSISPVLLDISSVTGIKIDELNLVFSFFIMGGILGMLTSVFYNKWLPRLKIIIAGYIFIILLMLFPVFFRMVFLFYLSYLLIGYLVGVVWIQSFEDLLVSKVKNKDRIISFGLSFYPLGAVVSPLLASTIIDTGLDWRFIYLASTVLAIIIIVLNLLLKRKVPKANAEKHIGTDRGMTDQALSVDNDIRPESNRFNLKENFKDPSKNKLLALTVLILFTFMASQTVIITWGPTYFRLTRGFDLYLASLVVSVFFITNFIGRIITSIIITKIKTGNMLIILSMISLVSTFFIIFLEQKVFLFISLVLLGLGQSSIIPLAVSSTSVSYKRGKGFMASVLLSSGDIGAMLIPYLVMLVYGRGIQFTILLAVYFIGATALFILIRFFYMNLKKQESK